MVKGYGEDLRIRNAIHIKVNIRTIESTVKEFILGLTGINIGDNSKMISKMDQEKWYIQMGLE